MGKHDSVDDDEIVYRRIPRAWFDPQKAPFPAIESFKPTPRDHDGLSLDRARDVSMNVAARGQPGKSYYLACLSVRAVRELGLDVVCDRPGHCLIPQLIHETRRTPQSREWQLQLTKRCSIDGPFEPPPME